MVIWKSNNFLNSIHVFLLFNHLNNASKKSRGVFFMKNGTHQGASNNRGSFAKNPSSKKEEISLELAELGNLKPKRGSMSPNRRDVSERERSYE